MMSLQSKSKSLADLICYSHLRWSFVFQRPQHLMSRFAKARRVFFVEEPVFEECTAPEMLIKPCPQTGVMVATPRLPLDNPHQNVTAIVSQLIDNLIREYSIQNHVAWYYTPMALDVTQGLKPAVTVYDCMDELTLFKNAPPALGMNGRMLLAASDLVFTGGYSLYEAKQHQHPHVHCFPSSVDCAHFSQARHLADSAPDQNQLPSLALVMQA